MINIFHSLLLFHLFTHNGGAERIFFLDNGCWQPNYQGKRSARAFGSCGAQRSECQSLERTLPLSSAILAESQRSCGA